MTYTLVPKGDTATPRGKASSAEVALPPEVTVEPETPAVPATVKMGTEHAAEPSSAMRLYGQARQPTEPSDGAYVSIGHSAHAVEFTPAENMPAGHAVHADEPGLAE